MLPAASVSGLYFAHPDSTYFAVGKMDRDQVRNLVSLFSNSARSRTIVHEKICHRMWWNVGWLLISITTWNRIVVVTTVQNIRKLRQDDHAVRECKFVLVQKSDLSGSARVLVWN